MTPPELSPLGAERDRPVPCQRCGRQTFNHSALCDDHLDRLVPAPPDCTAGGAGSWPPGTTPRPALGSVHASHPVTGPGGQPTTA